MTSTTQKRHKRNAENSPSTSEVVDDVAKALHRKHSSAPPYRPNSLISRLTAIWLHLIIAVVFLTMAYVYRKFMLFETAASPLEGDLSTVPFVVVDIPGKGKGAIANRHLRQGELILREAPLILVPNKVTTHLPGALIRSSLALLSPSDRASFYNLSYVNLPAHITPDTPAWDDALALAIMQTNAISAGDDTGIFPRTARLNHGCSSAFNSVYTWREHEGVLVVHALKPIHKGQELLTTYTDTKRPREERRLFLRDHYGFTCQCSVCSLPNLDSQISDQRLSKMTGLYTQLASWQHGTLTGKEAVQIVADIWRLGEAEGYWSERGRLAADAAWVAAAHSDATSVRAWAELAKKWYTYEVGADSVQVRDAEETIAHPWMHVVWGTREAEYVGGPDPSW